MDVLLTENGNFFVATNGNYGYFDQSGNLLRVSDENDWQWAAERMEVYKGEFDELNLDLASLERVPSPEEINSQNRPATFADLMRTALA